MMDPFSADMAIGVLAGAIVGSPLLCLIVEYRPWLKRERKLTTLIQEAQSRAGAHLDRWDAAEQQLRTIKKVLASTSEVKP